MTKRSRMTFAALLFLLACFRMVLGQELVRATYCWNQDFRLDCDRTSMLAIHEAYFTNDEAAVNASSCPNARDGREACQEDVRISINKRCSGMSHCHYNLTEDHPDRLCRCKGVIVIVYACISETQIRRYCNTRISGSSGYISSPGYPRFHPKSNNCTWNIESSENHPMKISILDLDMRPGMKVRGRELCPDSLTVLQDSHKVKTVCGHATNVTQIPILTDGQKVHVAFSTQEFLPSRGFLLYYRYNGCVELPAPKLGYMVYSNNRSALYMCCKGHLFNDTLTNSRLLHCVDGSHWNATVSTCLSLEEIKRTRANGSEHLDDLIEIGNADVVEVYLINNKYIEEILIPTASVILLVFGNIGIIFIIQRIRKNRKSNAANNNHNGRSTSSNQTTSPPDPQKMPPVQKQPLALHVPLAVPALASEVAPPVAQKPPAPHEWLITHQTWMPAVPPERLVLQQRPPSAAAQKPPVEARAPRVLITDL